MSVKRIKKIYTVEFTTFVIKAYSKEEAGEIILKYIKKQSVDLKGFFNQRAKVIEKETFAE